MGLNERLAAWGRDLGRREAANADALDEAWDFARELHARVADALSEFHAETRDAGVPQVHIDLSEPHTDDKHIRSVEIDLSRGRHRAIITVKTEGVVTLVGPFKHGKTEGPCRRFETHQEAEIEDALVDLFEAFIDQAFAP